MTHHLWIAPVGSLGADTSGSVSSSQAQACKARGLSFLLRSLRCAPGGGPAVVVPTPEEVARIFAAGLALGLYQTFRETPLSADLGKADAAEAVKEALAIGYPPGACIYGDAEGQASNTVQADLAYWEAWGEAIKAAGYIAGVYVGPGPKLNGAQWGGIPAITSYWQAGALVPTPTPRGFGMYQLNPPNVNIGGQVFDLDCTQVDFKGGSPVFCGPVLQGNNGPLSLPRLRRSHDDS